jgi:hypothetical protein
VRVARLRLLVIIQATLALTQLLIPLRYAQRRAAPVEVVEEFRQQLLWLRLAEQVAHLHLASETSSSREIPVVWAGEILGQSDGEGMVVADHWVVKTLTL